MGLWPQRRAWDGSDYLTGFGLIGHTLNRALSHLRNVMLRLELSAQNVSDGVNTPSGEKEKAVSPRKARKYTKRYHAVDHYPKCERLNQFNILFIWCFSWIMRRF
jgi:uncharacterized protein (UPF0128 family)